jgi:hypothetical protein
LHHGGIFFAPWRNLLPTDRFPLAPERNLAVFFARFQQSFRFGLLVKCWSLVGRVLVYKKTDLFSQVS